MMDKTDIVLTQEEYMRLLRLESKLVALMTVTDSSYIDTKNLYKLFPDQAKEAGKDGLK